MVKGKQSWGCTSYRDGCAFRLPFEFSGKKLSDTNIKLLCRKGRSAELKTGSGENEEIGNVILNRDFTLSFESKAPEELRCPKCKKGLIIKGKAAWGCAEFRSGCTFRIPFLFLGKNLSENNMEQLVLKGKTAKISGFSGDEGFKRDGRVEFDDEFSLIID